jgi:cysteine-rich repeat protein
MQRFSLLALLVIACGPTPAPLDDAAREPAALGRIPLPQDMLLTAGPAIPGDTMLLTAVGAVPGDRVHFLKGAPGTSCPAQLGGACLDIDGIEHLGSAVADATGEAVLPVVINITLPVGRTPAFQAVVTVGAPYASDVVQVVTVSVCGDGLLQSDEDCDDGGAVDGDGCSAACEHEVAADAFQIWVGRGRLTTSNPASGLPWDIDPFGIFVQPDAYFEASIDATLVYRSNTANDDRTPEFDDTFEVEVLAGNTLYLDFYDEDPFGAHEFVGTVAYTHADLQAVLGAGILIESDWGLDSVEIEVQ